MSPSAPDPMVYIAQCARAAAHRLDRQQLAVRCRVAASRRASPKLAVASPPAYLSDSVIVHATCATAILDVLIADAPDGELDTAAPLRRARDELLGILQSCDH